MAARTGQSLRAVGLVIRDRFFVAPGGYAWADGGNSKTQKETVSRYRRSRWVEMLRTSQSGVVHATSATDILSSPRSVLPHLLRRSTVNANRIATDLEFDIVLEFRAEQKPDLASGSWGELHKITLRLQPESDNVGRRVHDRQLA